jgi:hypothetical protein
VASAWRLRARVRRCSSSAATSRGSSSFRRAPAKHASSGAGGRVAVAHLIPGEVERERGGDDPHAGGEVPCVVVPAAARRVRQGRQVGGVPPPIHAPRGRGFSPTPSALGDNQPAGPPRLAGPSCRSLLPRNRGPHRQRRCAPPRPKKQRSCSPFRSDRDSPGDRNPDSRRPKHRVSEQEKTSHLRGFYRRARI